MTKVKLQVGNAGPDPVEDAKLTFTGLDALSVSTPAVSQGTWEAPVWEIGTLEMDSTATIDMDVTNQGEEEVSIEASISSSNEDPNLSNNVYSKMIPVFVEEEEKAPFSLGPRIEFQAWENPFLYTSDGDAIDLGKCGDPYSKAIVHRGSNVAVWPDGDTSGFWIFNGKTGEKKLIDDGISFDGPPTFSPSGERFLVPHYSGSTTVARIYDVQGNLVRESQTAGSNYIMAGEEEFIYDKKNSIGTYLHQQYGDEVLLFEFNDIPHNRFLHSDGQDIWVLGADGGNYSIVRFDMSTEEIRQVSVPGYIQIFDIHERKMLVTFEGPPAVILYDMDTCQEIKNFTDGVFDLYGPHGSFDSSGRVVIFAGIQDGGAPEIHYSVFDNGDYDNYVETGKTGQDYNTYQGYHQIFMSDPLVKPLPSYEPYTLPNRLMFGHSIKPIFVDEVGNTEQLEFPTANINSAREIAIAGTYVAYKDSEDRVAIYNAESNSFMNIGSVYDPHGLDVSVSPDGNHLLTLPAVTASINNLNVMEGMINGDFQGIFESTFGVSKAIMCSQGEFIYIEAPSNDVCYGDINGYKSVLFNTSEIPVLNFVDYIGHSYRLVVITDGGSTGVRLASISTSDPTDIIYVEIPRLYNHAHLSYHRLLITFEGESVMLVNLETMEIRWTYTQNQIAPGINPSACWDDMGNIVVFYFDTQEMDEVTQSPLMKFEVFDSGTLIKKSIGVSPKMSIRQFDGFVHRLLPPVSPARVATGHISLLTESSNIAMGEISFRDGEGYESGYVTMGVHGIETERGIRINLASPGRGEIYNVVNPEEKDGAYPSPGLETVFDIFVPPEDMGVGLRITLKNLGTDTVQVCFNKAGGPKVCEQIQGNGEDSLDVYLTHPIQ